MQTQTQTLSLNRPRKLYSHQAEALFLLTLNENVVVSMPKRIGKSTMHEASKEIKDSSTHVANKNRRATDSQAINNTDHVRFCLWLTYQFIVTNQDKNLPDSTIIWFMRNNFNIESNLVVSSLKALENIYACVNAFVYNNDKKCKKRYNLQNKDQSLIMEWCKQFETQMPQVSFMKQKLVYKQ